MIIKVFCYCKMEPSYLLRADAPKVSEEDRDRFLAVKKQLTQLTSYLSAGFNKLDVNRGLPSEVKMPDNFASFADIVVYVLDSRGELIFVGKLCDFGFFFKGNFGDMKMYVDENTIDVAITKFLGRAQEKENADNLMRMMENANVV